MMKRIWSGLVAAGFLAWAMPAAAETQSRTCLAVIKAANVRHRAEAVPDDCWRMGPLRLGMTLAQVRTLLGAPGSSQTLIISYRRRKYPITRLFYIYPRNLRNWLKLAPARQADFHLVALRLDFTKDGLAAISVDDNARVTPPPCRPSAPGHGFVHKAEAFPYGFHGLTLGAPLSEVVTHFGRFASSDPSRNLYNYWPVPLAVSAKDKVTSIRIATGMAFTAAAAGPDIRLQLDPRSCFVTGYTVAAGH